MRHGSINRHNITVRPTYKNDLNYVVVIQSPKCFNVLVRVITAAVQLMLNTVLNTVKYNTPFFAWFSQSEIPSVSDAS